MTRGHTALCRRLQARRRVPAARPASTPWGPCTRCEGNRPFPMTRQTSHSSCRLLSALTAKKTGCRPWSRVPKPRGRNHRGGEGTPDSPRVRARRNPGAAAAAAAPARRPRPWARARVPIRAVPPPHLPPNQQLLPAALSANRHTPRRIALGGVWKGD